MIAENDPAAVPVLSKIEVIQFVPSTDASIVRAAVVHAAGATNPTIARLLQSTAPDTLAPLGMVALTIILSVMILSLWV